MQNALLIALRSGIALEHVVVGGTFSLLDGLMQQNRWRNCLLTVDDAYDFACTLLKFSAQIIHDKPPSALSSAIGSVATPALNAWLRPAIPFTTQPSVAALSSEMFGEAWCDFIGPENMANGEAILLTKALRPPFRQGLIEAQLEVESIDLPGLDTM